MRSQNDKATWSILRFDHRTFTAQLARMQKVKPVTEIPDKYIYIDDYCFKGDGKIKEVILPSSCRIIGREAFASCQFRKPVIFPQTFLEIKEGAFAENHSLKEATFPASMEAVGAYCYKGCTALKTIKFEADSKCLKIPESCFHSCTQLNKVAFPDKIKSIENRAFYRCKELTEITLPDTLEEIGLEAFYFCGFETLELPKGLWKLDHRSFFGCKKLKNVYIPANITFIGEEAFHGCNRLEYLEIHHDPEYIGSRIVNKNCTIRCKKGSKVDLYCEEQGLKREYI